MIWTGFPTHEGRRNSTRPPRPRPRPAACPSRNGDSVVQAVTAAVERYSPSAAPLPAARWRAAPPSRLAAPGVVAWRGSTGTLEQRASRPCPRPACGAASSPPPRLPRVPCGRRSRPGGPPRSARRDCRFRLRKRCPRRYGAGQENFHRTPHHRHPQRARTRRRGRDSGPGSALGRRRNAHAIQPRYTRQEIQQYLASEHFLVYHSMSRAEEEPSDDLLGTPSGNPTTRPSSTARSNSACAWSTCTCASSRRATARRPGPPGRLRSGARRKARARKSASMSSRFMKA